MEKQEVIYIEVMWLVLGTLENKVKMPMKMNTYKKNYAFYRMSLISKAA